MPRQAWHGNPNPGSLQGHLSLPGWHSCTPARVFFPDLDGTFFLKAPKPSLTLIPLSFAVAEGSVAAQGTDVGWVVPAGRQGPGEGPGHLPTCQDVQGAQAGGLEVRPWEALPESVGPRFTQRWVSRMRV